MYFDDLKLGMTADTAPAVIEKKKMLQFAYDYDNVPLHTDEEYAKTTHFKKLIAPGVMSFMAVWANFVELGFFGDELVAGLSTTIRWYKPVFAGDVLTGKAVVTNIVRRNAYNGIAEVTVDVVNQHGERVLSDVTESVVKYRQGA